jgi:hypothetical protein
MTTTVSKRLAKALIIIPKFHLKKTFDPVKSSTIKLKVSQIQIITKNLKYMGSRRGNHNPPSRNQITAG